MRCQESCRNPEHHWSFQWVSTLLPIATHSFRFPSSYFQCVCHKPWQNDSQSWSCFLIIHLVFLFNVSPFHMSPVLSPLLWCSHTLSEPELFLLLAVTFSFHYWLSKLWRSFLKSFFINHTLVPSSCGCSLKPIMPVTHPRDKGPHAYICTQGVFTLVSLSPRRSGLWLLLASCFCVCFCLVNTVTSTCFLLDKFNLRIFPSVFQISHGILLI